MSMSSWKILIERGNLEFSAAHFITFDGECEPLHGHNYGVRVEAAGELTADSYVVDFVVMKDIVRTLIKRWDHRFLLPLQNPHLRISEQEDAWEIEFAGEEAAAFLREHGRIRYQMPLYQEATGNQLTTRHFTTGPLRSSLVERTDQMPRAQSPLEKPPTSLPQPAPSMPQATDWDDEPTPEIPVTLSGRLWKLLVTGLSRAFDRVGQRSHTGSPR